MEKIKEIINKILGKPSDSSDSSSGFTLIELLIVIAVIGILAAALLVAIDPIDKIRAGNDTKVINDVRAIYDGANRAYTTTYTVPANITAIIATGELKAEPKPPSGYGTSYGYIISGSGDSVVAYGQVQSKSNKTKAGNVNATNAYFVATSGGGCYSLSVPNGNTLPSAANPLVCN